MKILFLTENFPPEVNAAAGRVYERACYWREWGHEITVITTAPNFPTGKVFEGYKNRWYSVEDVSGIRVIRVKSLIFANRGVVGRTLDFLSFMVSGTIGALVQERPDVIVATSPQFFAAVAGCFSAMLRGVPFVFELSDLWPASIVAVGAMKKGFALRRIEKLELFMYRRAAAVVALTRAFKDDLVGRGIAAEKISVIRNGVDLTRFKPLERVRDVEQQIGAEGKFIAGYIGTHGMAHGLLKVIDAAEILEKRDPDVRVMFVGAGADREAVEREVERRGLHNVILVSRQPKEKIASFWSVCDCALIPLRDDKVFTTVIPSKLFEAMGMGIPVIMAVPTSEATEIVQREKVGLCVAPENPEQLAEAILKLKSDCARREEYARNCVKAAPRYSRETQAREMIEVLGRVASPAMQKERATAASR